jgi:DNA polymerase III subunit alpha
MSIHLRPHTEFSVVDDTNRIDDVARIAAKDGQPAFAITDLNNLFGAIKFYKEARGKGVKPLIGAEIMLEGLGADPTATSRIALQMKKRLQRRRSTPAACKDAAWWSPVWGF